MKWYLLVYHWGRDSSPDLGTEVRYGPFVSFDVARGAVSVVAMAEKVDFRDVSVVGFLEDDEEDPSHDD